jgi:hypothetical protein
MNCREFEKCLLQLANNEVLESAGGETALNHAETCSRCAARLADERSLKIGLRAVALIARSEKAPAPLEIELRKRFREWHAGSKLVSGLGQDAWNGARKTELGSHLSVRPRYERLRQALVFSGVAAAMLLLIGLVLSRKPVNLPSGPATYSSKPEIRPSPSPLVSDEAVIRKDTLDVSNKQAVVAGKDDPKHVVLRKMSRRHPPNSQHRGRVQESWLDEQDDVQPREIQTEFLPFMAYRPLSPEEQRQIVRVRLPRSALHVFGLPINMERSREPVQADVVLGEDGTALAVRFVR